MRNSMRMLTVICIALTSFAFSSAIYAKKNPAQKGDTPQNSAADSAEEKSADENPYGATSTDESAEMKETPPVEGSASSETPAAEGGSLRRSNRLEFDERLIKGQVAKSGAVYLFQRMPRHLPGLVPMRRSYRARIVEPVLGQRALLPIKKTEKVVKPPPPTKAVEGGEAEQTTPPELAPNANGKSGPKSGSVKPQDKKRAKPGKQK